MRFPWHPSVGIHQRLQLLNGSSHHFSHFSHAAQQSLHADALPLHKLLPVLPEGELFVAFGTCGDTFVEPKSMGKNGKRCKHVQTWSCFRHFTIEHDRICQQNPRMGRLEALATWGSQQRIFLQRWSQIDICNRWNDRSGLSNLM